MACHRIRSLLLWPVLGVMTLVAMPVAAPAWPGKPVSVVSNLASPPWRQREHRPWPCTGLAPLTNQMPAAQCGIHWVRNSPNPVAAWEVVRALGS